MEQVESYLVWIDLEMTGLDVHENVIIEISTIITNNALDIVAQGPSLVISQPDCELEKMDEWCTRTHTCSGLVKLVKESSMTLEQAQVETLDFIKKYIKPNKAPLCGNSVWQDRIFLKKYMPELESYLHYRIIDVSSIKEVVTRWYPGNRCARFVKPENHRAMEDIIYSIEELKHYRAYFFLKN